jgi:hypothetical protein
MKKWIAVVLVVALGLAGFVGAGPYIALYGIRDALSERDAGRLQRYVDFPLLRANLRAQAEDALARRTGSEVQRNVFGSLALRLANAVAGTGVDAMVTPTGIAALLQGHAVWNRARGDTIDGDTYGPPRPADPLRQATRRYESPSRFTATVHTEAGQSMVFVFTRQGLRWKLTDIRLPL